MKIINISILVLCFIIILASTAMAESIKFGTGNRTIVPVELTNTTISALDFTVTGLPIKSITCQDPSKQVDFNVTDLATGTNRVIVYGINKTIIKAGVILSIEFITPNPYGQYQVKISNTCGASQSAAYIMLSVGGDGVVALTFQSADVVAEAAKVVGKSSVGSDINGDGVINAMDVQIMANNVA